MTKLMLGLAVVGLVIAGCSDQNNGLNGGEKPSSGQADAIGQEKARPPAQTVARWYSWEQVERGHGLFQNYCAECHKPDASGDPNWKQLDAEGKLPPPPLNGTAHAWHHPLPLLRRIVRNGGVPMGGSMPPFKDKLKPDEIDAILAWVQSHWSDEIYATWSQINQRK